MKRTELIVPIRDRRQHRRVLTLRNFRNACIVLVALFVGITILANLRDRHPREDYGRLVSPRIESPDSLPKHPTVPVTEPIDDQNGADPTLMQAAARAQILRDEPPVPPPPPVLLPENAPTAITKPMIVGGPEGVKIVQGGSQQPVLHGGFGR